MYIGATQGHRIFFSIIYSEAIVNDIKENAINFISNNDHVISKQFRKLIFPCNPRDICSVIKIYEHVKRLKTMHK